MIGLLLMVVGILPIEEETIRVDRFDTVQIAYHYTHLNYYRHTVVICRNYDRVDGYHHIEGSVLVDEERERTFLIEPSKKRIIVRDTWESYQDEPIRIIYYKNINYVMCFNEDMCWTEGCYLDDFEQRQGLYNPFPPDRYDCWCYPR